MKPDKPESMPGMDTADAESAGIQNRLGIDYRNRGLTDEALHAFKRALAFKPDDPESHRNLTDLLLETNRYNELGSACTTALSLAPDDAEMHCKLAIALERTHRLPEARSAAESALTINPRHPRAQLTLAKIERRSGELKAARTRLEKLQYARLTPPQLSAVLGELGDVYDRLGEYTLAFYSFHAGNQAMLKMVDPAKVNPNAIFEWIARHRQIFTSQFMNDWNVAEPNDDVQSPVFLVGFPRSGTTLTEQIIIASGRMVPSDEEDVLYQLIQLMPKVLGRPFRYPDDLTSLTQRELTLLRRHYWTLAKQMLRGLPDEKILLDKLPLNLIELGFIHRLFPNARVIVSLRDPRDSCLSCFMRGFVPNQAMINFVTPEQSARFYDAVMGYWMHLKAFIHQPWLEVRYEDIVTDFENSARRLLEFLELEWSDDILNFHKQAARRDVRTPSYGDISQPIFTRAVGRWKHYAGPMSTTQSILLPYVRAFGYDESY